MTIAKRNQSLHAIIETTPGTFETPGATDVLEVEDLTYLPMEDATFVERNPVRSTYGPQVPLYGGSLAGVTFSIELKGSGAAGTAPRVGRILRAAAFAETIVAATSVTYEPTSDVANHETLSLVFRDGPNLRQLKGCVVQSLSLNVETRGRPMLEVSIKGKIESEAEGAALAETFETTRAQAFINAGFSVGGANKAIAALAVEMGLEVNAAPDPNATDGFGRLRITDRAVTGSFDPEAEAISAYDPIGQARAETEFAITTGAIGATAGNIVTLTLPRCRVLEVSDDEREMLKVYGVGFGAYNTTGDDEVAFAFT